MSSGSAESDFQSASRRLSAVPEGNICEADEFPRVLNTTEKRRSANISVSFLGKFQQILTHILTKILVGRSFYRQKNSLIRPLRSPSASLETNRERTPAVAGRMMREATNGSGERDDRHLPTEAREMIIPVILICSNEVSSVE